MAFGHGHEPALAFFVVALIWLAGAAALALIGRERVKAVSIPQQTVQSLKEDVQWAKAQKS